MESNWERAVCTVLRGRGKKKHHSSLDPPVMHHCTTVHVRTTRTSAPLSLVRIHLTLNAMGHQTLLLFPLYTHMFSHLPLSIFGPKNHLRCGDGGKPPKERSSVFSFCVVRLCRPEEKRKGRLSVGESPVREREKEEHLGGERSTQESKRKALEKAGRRKKGGFRRSVCGCVLQWSLAPEVGVGRGEGIPSVLFSA